MALNLWKLGGKPTAYSPLPTGYGSYVNVGLSDYIITIKAKSISGAIMRVGSDSTIFNDIVLNNISKYYSISFKGNAVDFRVFVVDVNSIGNIIIDSIELVQKPLPKLTINGIDGFSSGKWTLHANAKVIDDETLELNATANDQYSYLRIPCLPSAVYSFSNGVYGYLRNGGSYVAPVNPQTGTFTTYSTATEIEIRISNAGNGTGKFTFKRPMLNLGSIPAPYEKKRGDKMVLPTAKKNLMPTLDAILYNSIDSGSGKNNTIVNGKLAVTSNNAATLGKGLAIDVVPNKPYVLSSLVEASSDGNYGAIYIGYSVSGTEIAYVNSTIGNYVKSFTPTQNKIYIKFAINIGVATDIPCYFSNLQLEEGTTATPYTPYAVQVNPKPKKYVPKKNMIPNKNLQYWDSIYRYTPAISLTGTKLYSISSSKTDITIGVRRVSDSVDIVPLGTTLPCTFIPSTSGDYYIFFKQGSSVWGYSNNPMETQLKLEEGSVVTPYEIELPRAKTGSAFNGATDYLQLPSMTMDSVEIDCLIDSVQPDALPFLFDARNGLANGYAYPTTIGTGVLKMFVDGVEKPTKVWTDIPKGVRTKVKFTSSQFTDDVNIFSQQNTQNRLKGILYKVTCYLNGAEVARYDFENVNNLVGDKVIPQAVNLIPSFEDARWSLHANFKVLGKDVGRLEATGVAQETIIYIPCIPNKQYMFSFVATGNGWIGAYDKPTGTYNERISTLLNDSKTGVYYFTTPSNCTYLKFSFNSNSSGGAGSFDFIKPQLYALDGTEGTLFGKPTALKRASKRTLCAKR